MSEEWEREERREERGREGAWTLRGQIVSLVSGEGVCVCVCIPFLSVWVKVHWSMIIKSVCSLCVFCIRHWSQCKSPSCHSFGPVNPPWRARTHTHTQKKERTETEAASVWKLQKKREINMSFLIWNIISAEYCVFSYIHLTKHLSVPSCVSFSPLE